MTGRESLFTDDFMDITDAPSALRILADDPELREYRTAYGQTLRYGWRCDWGYHDWMAYENDMAVWPDWAVEDLERRYIKIMVREGRRFFSTSRGPVIVLPLSTVCANATAAMSIALRDVEQPR